MDLETITVNGTSQTQRLDQETQYVDSRKKHRRKGRKRRITCESRGRLAGGGDGVKETEEGKGREGWRKGRGKKKEKKGVCVRDFTYFLNRRHLMGPVPSVWEPWCAQVHTCCQHTCEFTLRGQQHPQALPIPSSALTELIHCIDIGVAGDELFHHSLHRQAGCQDQCSRAICHSGIQVSGAVPDENLTTARRAVAGHHAKGEACTAP